MENIFLNYDSDELYGFGVDDVPKKYKFKEAFKNGLWGDEYYIKIKQSKIVINLFKMIMKIYLMELILELLKYYL